MKSKQVTTTLLLSALLIAGLIMVNGCKKSEPAAAPMPAPTTAPVEKPAAIKTEQTTCPVMGGAINKDIFTEYKGKKVYFCCPGCKENFEAAPEQYLAKLPQFQQR